MRFRGPEAIRNCCTGPRENQPDPRAEVVRKKKVDGRKTESEAALLGQNAQAGAVWRRAAMTGSPVRLWFGAR